MEHEIKSIPLMRVDTALPCVGQDRKTPAITENDPAIKVMTDFAQTRPITVEPVSSIDLALEKMKSYGVRLLLVTDEQDYISGVITSYDIQSEKPVKYAETSGISHTDILVSMIMTPLSNTPAFDFEYVQQTLVRHIIHTMQELHRPHTLVIERTNQQKIRGMFSTSQISKILGKSIYRPLHTANSFADIQREIEHTV